MTLAFQSFAAAGMSWDMAERTGSIAAPDGYRGWHVVVWVKYPGANRARRERITNVEGFGKIETKAEAERVLKRFQAQCIDRPAHEVISDYKKTAVPENSVIHRWNHEFLKEQQARHQRGEIGWRRMYDLERFEVRGYLEFWRRHSIYGVSTAAIEGWLIWLQQEYPHMKPASLVWILRFFGAFVRFEHKIGVIRELPEIPQVKVPRQRKRVPNPDSLRRILECIPEESRGLWLARSYAGLRPAEARRLSVIHYRDGTIHLPAEIVKTGEPRSLHVRIVCPELEDWILKFRSSTHPGEPLFPMIGGRSADRRWRQGTESDTWRRACEQAGVEYVAPNVAGRHAFATHELHGGTSPLAVQQWMGHSQFKTTEVYLDEWDEVELARVMRPKTAQAQPSAQEPSDDASEK